MSEGGGGRRTDDADGFLVRWGRLEAQYLGSLRAVATADGDWRENLRAAAWQSVRWAESDPGAARFLTVDVLGTGSLGRQCQRTLGSHLLALLEGWLREAPAAARPGLARWVLGLFYASFHRHLATGSIDRLAGEVPQLMFLAVSPVCGAEVALRELSLAQPR